MTLSRPKIQGVVLALVALALYYPALFAPFSPLDDQAIIEWLLNQQAAPLREVFTRTTEYYYRPVLWLSYIADFHLWGTEASFMHLGNMLLHVANVLLLYACARLAFAVVVPESRWLAFAAALLFAIHPINTEAVNWIAARSDLLSGFFVLLATWLLFYGLGRRRSLWIWLSLLPLLLGCLAKETAVFFLPAALVIIFCGLSARGEPFSWREQLPFMFPLLLLPAAYFLVRGPTLLRHDAGLGLMGKLAGTDVIPALQATLAGIGFYTKKLFWPWPLNLTIDQVDPLYAWLGAIVVAALCHGLRRRGFAAGMLAAAVCLGFSALLVILLRPAWTPVAERYLYIPGMFFCLGIVLPARRLWQATSWRRPLLWGVVVVGAVVTVTTIQRNLLWQDNIRLFEDAVRKSPDFPFAKTVLAGLLMTSERKAEGAAMIRENVAPPGLRNADFLDFQRAQLLLSERRYQEARALILAKRREGAQLYYKFQELLAKVDVALLQAPDGVDSAEIFTELVALYLELNRVYREPFYHYQLAQLYLRTGDRAKAADYFRQAGEAAPESTHYKAAALKLADSLGK